MGTRLFEMLDSVQSKLFTDLKIVQEIMGHKNFRTTMDIYNEATAARKAASFKCLEGKFKLAWAISFYTN